MKKPIKKKIYEVTMTPVMNDLLAFLGEYVYYYGRNKTPKLLITNHHSGKITVEHLNFKGESCKFRISKANSFEFYTLNKLFRSMIK